MTTQIRRKRESESVILGILNEQTVTLALLQKGQEDTNLHLLTLNGKVVAHEGRLNDQSLINQRTTDTFDKIDKRLSENDTTKKENSDWKRDLANKVGWSVFVMFMFLFYKILVAAGLISNFLNK